MSSYLLKNGYVVDSKNNVEGKHDLLIRDGVVVQVSASIVAEDAEVIDCTGLCIIPGLCDMHVHFRDPGYTYKEDLFSGSEAAAAGGVTAVLCMPNTSPVVDSPEIVQDILKRAKDAKIKIYAACSLTKGLLGEELCDYEALRKAGAVAATDDGRPVENSRTMQNAMLKAYNAGLRVISHCEDMSLTNGGLINEGRVSKALGIKGVIRASENVATARDVFIAEAERIPIHIAHVSTAEAVKIIRSSLEIGAMVTAETAPHYFTLTEDKLLSRDADYRMAPPLRTQQDVRAIISAIIDGTIDCIITDHAPHSKEEKADFLNAPNGVIGLETSLAATLTALYHTGYVPLSKIVRLMCINPRRLLGIPGGGLERGAAADIAVFDPNEQWVVDPENMRSKSKNTCFKGMTFKGKVKYTFVDGELVFKD